MICYPLDNTAYSAKDMGAYLCTRTRGVFSGNDNLAVIANNSMSITINPGIAWLKWAAYWGVSAVLELPTTLTLSAADGTLSRIDAVVYRLDKINNLAEVIIKKGSYASVPTVAAPVRNDNYDELYLATIFIAPGTIKITQNDIADQRMNEAYCGLMRDGVTGIPTAQLQAQAQELINHLQNVINGIEHGSEVMLQTVYDTNGNGIVDNAAAVPWTGVTGKPATYPPSTHTHDDRYYTDVETDTKLNAKANTSGSYPYITAGNAANANYATSAGNAANSDKIAGHALAMTYNGDLWIDW